MKKPSLPPCYKGPLPFVYFSFCSEDRDPALRILQAFSRRYRVWYDLSGKTDQEALNCAEIFVCVLSPLYMQDQRCKHEYLFAQSAGKAIIPVSLAPEGQSGKMNLSLSEDRAYPFDPDVSAAAPEKLLSEVLHDHGQDLSKCASESSPEPVRSADPEKPSGFFSRLFSRRKATDTVSFSVLSPRAVMPGSYGVIDLHMYTAAQREAVDRAIRENGGMVQETTKGGFTVRRETAVTARLESDDAEISDPLETQVWNGGHLHFDFRFRVPEDYPRSQAAFTCYIEYNGIPVTRLNFITAVSRRPDANALPAKVTRSDFRKAFISYSRKDEQRMLARVLGIHELAPEMKFWLDKQSMDAGDLWREEIKNAIDISDVLLLFWSVPASQSAEVEKEWRYGLEQRGLPFIAPVPLDPPQSCPPPDALNALNFSVRTFSRNDITEKLSFYNSKNIELV